MSPSSAATSDTIGVLVADSNRMQALLLTSALRRFHLSYPDIPKVLLVDTCDRELGVRVFCSGARGIYIHQ